MVEHDAVAAPGRSVAGSLIVRANGPARCSLTRDVDWRRSPCSSRSSMDVRAGDRNRAPTTVSVPLTRLRFQVALERGAARPNASAFVTAVAINSERAELPAASVTLTLPM